MGGQAHGNLCNREGGEMKRVVMVVLSVLLLVSPAQAGFFDFLFGTSEDNATAAPRNPQ